MTALASKLSIRRVLKRSTGFNRDVISVEQQTSGLHKGVMILKDQFFYCYKKPNGTVYTQTYFKLRDAELKFDHYHDPSFRIEYPSRPVKALSKTPAKDKAVAARKG